MSSNLGDLGYFCDGQLAAMGVEAAIKKGLHPVVFGLSKTSSAAQVILEQGGTFIHSDDYTNTHNLDAFAAALKAGAPVAFDWEGVPTDALEYSETNGLLMKPGPKVLQTTQHRGLEKTALNNIHGRKITAEYEEVTCFEDAQRAFQSFGAGRLKTSMGGYDGKGQWTINTEKDLVSAFSEMGDNIPELVYEKNVKFVKELSVAVGRNAEGDFAWYDPFLNHHKNGIIRTTHVGDIGVDQEVQDRMIDITKKTAEGLNVEGIMTLEMFLEQDGNIVANEVAARTHNSGHITRSTHAIDHFQLQIMAMLNEKMPGHIPLDQAGKMLNLIGDNIDGHSVNAGKFETAKFHISEKDYDTAKVTSYGKGEAKKGRKMGHVEIV